MGTLCPKPDIPTSIVTRESKSKLKSIDNIEDVVFDTVYKNCNNITKDYDIETSITGKGGFSEVRKAIHLHTNELRAVKIIYKKNWSKKQQKKILREIDVLRQLDHPNIIRIFEYFEDDKFIYLVMEYARNGELFNKLQSVKCFNEKEAAELFHQILSGVSYMHQNSIVHRDLKFENILMDGDVVKIADFGFSRVLNHEEKMTKSKGTIFYIAPEVLNGSYTEKCDVWACGVILYMLLSGRPPFNGRSDEVILSHILKGKYSLHIREFEHVSKEAKDLTQRMLLYDQTQRISIKDALNSKWFTKVMETANGVLDPNVMSNLKSFNLKNKMQQAVYMFLVNHLATKEEHKMLFDTFQALDVNQNGSISLQELIEGYKKIDININTIDVENMMKKIDLNKSGELNYSEFIIAAIERKKMIVDKRMKSCFDMIDTDKSGKISIAELKNVLQGKRSFKDNVWKELIELADLDQDGEISYKDFKELLYKIIE